MTISSELWQVADLLRSSGQTFNLARIVEVAKSRGISVSFDQVRQFEPLLSSKGEWLIPSTLADFFAALSHEAKPSKMLDPWAGHGSIIVPAVRAANPQVAVAIGVSPDDSRLGEELSVGSNIRWICDDPVTFLSEYPDEFDLIVSCPPFNYQRDPPTVIINDITIRDYYGNQIVAAALSRLSATGQAAVVLPPSTLFQHRESDLVSALSQFGVSIHALLHIPNGFFPATSAESYIAVLAVCRVIGLDL